MILASCRRSARGCASGQRGVVLMAGAVPVAALAQHERRPEPASTPRATAIDLSGAWVSLVKDDWHRA